MASSSAPYLGVEPEPNITQLCFSICSMILLSGFINKSKHIKTVTVTPTNATRAKFLATYKSVQPDLSTRSLATCSLDLRHELFYSFSRQLSTSNQVATCIYRGTVALRQGSHSSQTLSVAQQSNPTASLLYMWLNRKPKPFYYLNRSIQRVPKGGYRACTNQASITS
ncbi:hypothetical protein POTOM_035337 [Populus tomentosa]|uniref:Uncharacterized protein n=1 Tax=Populus tomentosa TaxID=118781 RepID=A0A8X7Z8J8_POPTO|nr:hypothetical protein POTOM_035337 [Populus tomentosa]